MTPLMFQTSRSSPLVIAVIGLALALFGIDRIGTPGVMIVRQLFRMEVPNSVAGVFMLIVGGALCGMGALWAIRPNQVLVDQSGIYFSAPFKKVHYPWIDIMGFSEGPGNIVRLHLTPGAEQRLGRNGKFAFIPTPPPGMQSAFNAFYARSRRAPAGHGYSRR